MLTIALRYCANHYCFLMKSDKRERKRERSKIKKNDEGTMARVDLFIF